MENVTLHRAGLTEFASCYEEILSGLVLILEDNGTGIPEEEKEVIFSRGLGTRRGMGLVLARRSSK
jgi:signal transduction histidine kinase